MMLKNHLDMIGRNEPIQRKAKFWQSYVRALKGTDDMRAPERTSSRPRGVFRPLLADFPELSSGWPYGKSIYEEPLHAVDRISVPGYRYLPVSRETYGYSPATSTRRPTGRVRTERATNTAQGGHGEGGNISHRHVDGGVKDLKGIVGAPVYDAKKAWDDHLKRLADIDRLYPSKYPLSARHSTPTPHRELTPFSSEPKDKVAYNYAAEKDGLKPVRLGAGLPIYNRGGYTRRPLMELFEPVSSLPLSRLTRDPWWWAYPSLRPYTLPFGWNKTPFYLRDSYLSPVKRTYLWGQHPIRPFGTIYNHSYPYQG
ncbi:hypothetical protein ANN_18569 [Periplaneta americana]|uniref:Myofilin n=1 Tax=Periplaneta americana TaxID=6978 RepID=A0ABQ8SQC6_PERAM|nr:hypothetical protein ANN_18569 [Periplaneta americana]